MEFMAREKRYSRVKWLGQNFHSKNEGKSMKLIENPSKSVPKIATNVPGFIEIDCAMVWKHNLTNSCTRNNEILDMKPDYCRECGQQMILIFKKR